MTNAAVAEAPAAESQTANPTPDSQATTPNGGASPNASAGTDGEQSASSTAQTATTPDASAPATPEAPDAVVATPERTLSPEDAIAEATRRLEAQAQEKQRADDLKRAQGELRDLRRDGPKQIRGLTTRLEKGEIDLPDFREAVENHIENLNAKALEAARLEIGDNGGEALKNEQDAFVRSCYAAIDPANRDAFSKDVDGKGHEAWVKATQKYAPKAPGVLSVDSFAPAGVSVASEAQHDFNDTEKAALDKALKAAKTPEAILAAGIEVGRLRGRRDPGEAPRGGERVSPNGTPKDENEARAWHASGKWSNHDFRSWQASRS